MIWACASTASRRRRVRANGEDGTPYATPTLLQRAVPPTDRHGERKSGARVGTQGSTSAADADHRDEKVHSCPGSTPRSEVGSRLQGWRYSRPSPLVSKGDDSDATGSLGLTKSSMSPSSTSSGWHDECSARWWTGAPRQPARPDFRRSEAHDGLTVHVVAGQAVAGCGERPIPVGTRPKACRSTAGCLVW